MRFKRKATKRSTLTRRGVCVFESDAIRLVWEAVASAVSSGALFPSLLWPVRSTAVYKTVVLYTVRLTILSFYRRTDGACKPLC